MNKDNKKKKIKLLSGRSGIIIVILLAVATLIVTIITMSYSWFEPEVKTGTGMHYEADIAVRSENCTLGKTYVGTVTNGKIDYNTEVTGEQEISAGSDGNTNIKYFKTLITNSDEYATNVSLYISELPAPQTSGKEYGLGVAVPSNSYRKYTSQQSDVYIIRNAYIEGESNNVDGEIAIEWFIRTKESAVTIDLDNLYLMYN